MTNNFEKIQEKVIVVTGGAGLIGKTFCSALASHGSTVIVADINEDYALQTATSIKMKVPNASIDYCSVDITSYLSVRKLIHSTSEKYGKIDAVVNNAYPHNKNYGRKFEDVTYEDFCENVNLHLGGYFLTAQQFAIYFEEIGGGSIINMASVYGIIAPKFEVYENTQMTMPIEYAAIKSAIIHMTKYMAKYYKGKNIRVNCISPGGISNGQAKEFIDNYNNHGFSKGLLLAEDITGVLLFLISDKSTYINGQNIVVDDGFII